LTPCLNMHKPGYPYAWKTNPLVSIYWKSKIPQQSIALINIIIHRRKCFPFPVRANDFSIHYLIQSGSGTNQTSYSLGFGDYAPLEVRWPKCKSDHLQPVPRFRILWGIDPLLGNARNTHAANNRGTVSSVVRALTVAMQPTLNTFSRTR
jgi:hypothetical protein